MTSYKRDGTVGEWAREKLECLEKYLNAYTTILRKKKFRGYFYFDAFAGAGRAPLRKRAKNDDLANALLDFAASDDPERQQYVDGSPRIALGIEHPFTRYVFVEKDTKRAAALTQLAAEFPGLSIRVEPSEANDAIRDLLIDNRRIDWAVWRGVVFLDPFGLQVPWRTIEAIGRTGALEVLINFPVGHTIQRLLPRDRLPTDGHQRLLDEYFGATEWRDIVYRSVDTLFDGQTPKKYDDAERRLVRWYRERLKAAFGFAPEPRLIKNSRGAHLYYLVFAGPNAVGAKIASDVLLKQGTVVR